MTFAYVSGQKIVCRKCKQEKPMKSYITKRGKLGRCCIDCKRESARLRK